MDEAPEYDGSQGEITVFAGLTGYEEVERYQIDPPYTFVSILNNEFTREYLYYINEPPLTTFERKVLEMVFKSLQEVILSLMWMRRTSTKGQYSTRTSRCS